MRTMYSANILILLYLLGAANSLRCYKGIGTNYQSAECTQCQYTDCMCISASPQLMYPSQQVNNGYAQNQNPWISQQQYPGGGRPPYNSNLGPPGYIRPPGNQYPGGPNMDLPRLLNFDPQQPETIRDCWPNPYKAEKPGCSTQTYQGHTYFICRCEGNLCNSCGVPVISWLLALALLAILIV